MTSVNKKQKGFTLVELLVVVGIIIIVMGFTGDIVLSLVRSYGKTKITNDLEQTGNYVMLKLEKELRTASGLSNVLNTQLTLQRTSEGTGIYVTYRKSGDLFQRCQSTTTTCTSFENLLPSDIAVKNSDIFTTISDSPQTVRVKLILEPSGTVVNPAFTGSIELSQTIVLRSTY
jgi:prepilin-type N-terminal cleavage/methylation domain-containing protein